MDSRRHRLVQRRGWDRATPHYERFWQRQLAGVHELTLATASVAPGHRVLDVACGNGAVTARLAAAVAPDGHVVATDLSPMMVAATAARADADGLGTVVTTRCCDAEDVDVSPSGSDEPFDVAICSLGLMYVADPARALNAMYQVVRPGGRIVVSVWGERHRCGWADLFGIVDARVDSDVCPMFFALGARDALSSAIAGAGFGDVEQHRLSASLDYVDDDEAVGAAFLGGPVALAHARFAPATRDEAYRDYLDAIAPHRTPDGGYRVPAEFVVVAARRP
jgi:ubiquinone/menaquinone biosynthesis C-methylase UbiE